jgi:hypothetical protein
MHDLNDVMWSPNFNFDHNFSYQKIAVTLDKYYCEIKVLFNTNLPL